MAAGAERPPAPFLPTVPYLWKAGYGNGRNVSGAASLSGYPEMVAGRGVEPAEADYTGGENGT